MTESISELRNICQDTRETDYFKMNWVPRHITRRVSIYFTKLCLKIGISANQASIIGLILVITGGAFFTFSDPRYWFIGALLCYGFRVFDCVDGEIARYNKSASIGGRHLDGSIGLFTEPYMLACMTFGIYNSLYNITAFMFGFLAVIATAFSASSALQLLVVAHREGLFPDRVDIPKKEPIIIQWGRIAFRVLIAIPGVQFIPQIFVAALIDCFISPFIILSLTFNARLIYLMVIGPVTLAIVVARIYYNVISYGKIKC